LSELYKDMAIQIGDEEHEYRHHSEAFEQQVDETAQQLEKQMQSEEAAEAQPQPSHLVQSIKANGMRPTGKTVYSPSTLNPSNNYEEIWANLLQIGDHADD